MKGETRVSTRLVVRLGAFDDDNHFEVIDHQHLKLYNDNDRFPLMQVQTSSNASFRCSQARTLCLSATPLITAKKEAEDQKTCRRDEEAPSEAQETAQERL